MKTLVTTLFLSILILSASIEAKECANSMECESMISLKIIECTTDFECENN